jgi:KaiC/GvpD/RAD55 family RecA-like ATPase
MADKTFMIRSGILALDGLFRSGNAGKTTTREEGGIFLRDITGNSTICIAGPDGTGKSILAMHFASRYVADSHQYCLAKGAGSREPLAFYVSSDLSHVKALEMWEVFALDRPNTRRIPFRHVQMRDEEPAKWLGGDSYDTNYELPLTLHEPDKLDGLADYLRGSNAPAQLAFIDLAAHTAGDDWGFIERLLVAMDAPANGLPRHLLVIDAMEGMETFAGDVDAFGEKTTRRRRVAKLMRLAARKCHLVLVIEEPSDGARMAEQFVADVVLRLRATESQGYSRRTIEIEKARGQSHIRGRHPYVIRDGRGSTTGEQGNFDDPAVEMEAADKSQSYMDVFPSLHSMSRAVMESRAPGREHPSDRRAGFGIPELDEMLALGSQSADGLHGQDRQGLPCGTVSALIGDANTQKSFLALAYLGHLFHDLAWKVVPAGDPPPSEEELRWPYEKDGQSISAMRQYYLCHFRKYEGEQHRPCSPEELSANVRKWASRIEKAGAKAGAAVLVTTKDENNRTLAERFCEQLQEETTNRATNDYDRTLVLEKRTELVAAKITEFLKSTNRFAKTIVFCENVDHAERMRKALVNANADLAAANSKYVMRITGDNDEGKAQLDNFIDPESTYPVIATTSQLMSTGVDAQTCHLIVLDKRINSMTEFKQIIGRGTRINEDYNKLYFTIMDFKRATALFADPAFDGDPVQIYEPSGDDPVVPPDEVEPEDEIGEDAPPPYYGAPLDPQQETPAVTRYYVDDVPVMVATERVQYLDADGNLITESLRDYTRKTVRKSYRSLDAFLSAWNAAERKQVVVDELASRGVFLEELAEEVGRGYDAFDLVCHVAFDQPPLTRRERADRVNKRNVFGKYGDRARAVLQALLDKYAESGIRSVESLDILKVDPLSELGTPVEIVRLFGGKEAYLSAVRKLESELYNEVA